MVEERNMAFVGNRKGPRESRIVIKLGPEYFGIDMPTLLRDVEGYEKSERQEAVVPVRVDAAGRAYIWFSRPTGRQKFYLDEHGYQLEGEVRIWEEDAQFVEVSHMPRRDR